MGREVHYRFRVRKALVFSLIAFTLVVAFILLFGEIMIRLLNSQPYMMPRYQYSARYGIELPASTVMTARRPGSWEFHYTINELGYRGKAIPISNRYDKRNIVVLGDSYSMGVGVDDEDVYSTVLAGELDECFDVINLGVGGYGLAHEIRRFYEFGVLYQPEVVILQFFHNDPADNVEDLITRIDDGKFRFVPTSTGTGWLKQALSDSVIQYSQTYNLLRNFAYRAVRSARLAKAAAPDVNAKSVQDQKPGLGDEHTSRPDQRQAIYIELLDAFAADLANRRIDLVFIAVNHSLDRFPSIQRRVGELDRAGQLRYVEVADWFEGISDYGSPEGHSWGAKAHRLVGENLARIVQPEHEMRDSAKHNERCAWHGQPPIP